VAPAAPRTHLDPVEDVMATRDPEALGNQSHTMKHSRRRAPFWRRTLLALCASVMLGGCYAEAAIPPPAVAVAYSPYYYEGYPVYYDTLGAPFVYVGGGVSYVPRSYAHYDVLLGGYHGPYHHEGPRYYSGNPRYSAPHYGAAHEAAPHYYGGGYRR
jgi:hypothetical protein